MIYIRIFRLFFKIDDIHNRHKVPIIVGGTNYYIQSLLWKNSLIDIDDRESNIEDKEILNAEPKIVYERLQEVDPVMASKWHWNDTRRVRRSLQVIYYLNFLEFSR
jgi:tRNA dimethylallyltransferase